LRDEVKGKSKASSRQMEKVCQSFYGYVPAPTMMYEYALTNSRSRDFEKLLTAVTEEQNKDKAYLIRFLKSPSIYDHIAGFKQKLEDARLNLIVCPVLGQVVC
jgi:hypothetical protein